MAAAKHHFPTAGVLQLYVQLEDLLVHTCFGVTDQLITKVLLWNLLMNRYIREVFPEECRMVPCQSRALPIAYIGDHEQPEISA